MRARNIKPGFFENEKLAECSPLARIFFTGLWCIADREGRIEDRPKRIKAKILPYDDCSGEDLLEELHKAGFIFRYQAQGYKVISIPTFLQHQRPHGNERDSKLPPYSEGLSTKVIRTFDHGTKSLVPKQSGLCSESLNPDSLNPESQKRKDSRVRARGGGDDDGNKSARRDKYSPEFERFWKAYPKKVGKGGAFKAWKRKSGEKPKIEQLEQILEQQRDSPQWKKEGGQYIPNPQTWLNQNRWEDDLSSGQGQERPAVVT